MATVYGRENLTWKGQRLYFKSKILVETKAAPIMGIRPTTYEPTMFYVEWPDGVMSADIYNLTRAKEHAMVIALAKLNNQEISEEI